MIKIVQACDRCGTERTLRSDSQDEKRKGGWRSLPVRTQYGEARDEQPWLDPDCLRAVEGFINRGVDQVINGGVDQDGQ